MQTSKQYGYKVAFNRMCTHSEREDKEWGSWEEEWSNSINTVIRKEEKYPDVTSKWNLEKGESALVVWVEWSSGDSFGHGTRINVEAIGLFKDLVCAEELKKQIEEHSKGNKSAYKFKTMDGQTFESGFASWSGYFESLDEVHIDAVTCF